jgi:hypothetical protein
MDYEIDLGLIYQCCSEKLVLETKSEYLWSLSLKINVNVRGRNTVLYDAIFLVSDKPTIIFGADVTYPNRGDHSSSSITTICYLL